MDTSHVSTPVAWSRPPEGLRGLAAWWLASKLWADCDRLAGVPPALPDPWLSARIRVAAGAVPAHVAAAWRSAERGDALHHLSIARGALRDLRGQIRVARERRYLPDRDALALDRRCGIVGGMVSRLVLSLYPPTGGGRGRGAGPARPAAPSCRYSL